MLSIYLKSGSRKLIKPRDRHRSAALHAADWSVSDNLLRFSLAEFLLLPLGNRIWRWVSGVVSCVAVLHEQRGEIQAGLSSRTLLYSIVSFIKMVASIWCWRR
jgi:hypothetical protein